MCMYQLVRRCIKFIICNNYTLRSVLVVENLGGIGLSLKSIVDNFFRLSHGPNNLVRLFNWKVVGYSSLT
jgi:hypothetical protein